MEEQVGEIEKNVLKKGKEREKELEEEVGERRISSRKNKGQPSQKFGDLSWPKKSSKTARTATTAYIAHLSVEPQTYEEAMSESVEGERWKKAMESELESMEKNKAWELTELPPGRTAISTKWVYRYKWDENGNIIRYKARLVARGFSQVYGVDYMDTFAPVAKMSSLRTLLSIAVHEDLEMHQMDVTSAFLLAPLSDEVYMEQPQGFNDGTGRVCRLLKSVYGLKQAPRVWYENLTTYLLKISFERLESDHCVFINRTTFAIIAVWVDDLIILGRNLVDVGQIKRQLSWKFQMKDLGELRHFLGIQVERDRKNRTLTIHQETYLRTILHRFGMSDCKPVSTPLPPGTKLVKATNEDRLIDPKLYQSIVGSLMYAMVSTRPDIAFAVQQLSQFCNKPTATHYQEAKRCLRYLKGTLTAGLTYYGDDSEYAIGFCDADHGAGEDRKSIMGYLFLMKGGAISWQAKKQSTVAISSTEAEYGALTQASKEFLWFTKLFTELKRPDYGPTILYSDNQGAIALAHNPLYHARTKHIDIQVHFIRECVSNDQIELQYCPTDDMVADVLTKALGREKHWRFMRMIGMETGRASSL
jgi:hypothetical protein